MQEREPTEDFPSEKKEFNFKGINVEGLLVTGRPLREHLLFVPGQGLTAENGKPVIEAFAQTGLSSFTMDLRGRGKSFLPDNFSQTKLEDYVKDVRCATLGLEKEIDLPQGKQILMGFSAGGLIAAEYAIEYPPRGLVLISSTLPRDLRFFAEKEGAAGEERRQKYLADLKPLIESNRPYDRNELINFYIGRGVFPPDKVEELRHLVDKESPAFIKQRYELIDIKPEQIRCPILVIGIKGDRAIPAESSQQLAEYLKADYLEGEGSHMIMFEEGWNPLSEQIRRWTETKTK